MSRKWFLIAVFVFVALAAGLWALTNYYLNLPERASQVETLVIGQDRYTPGSQAALRVVVRNRQDASPLEGADIKVSFQPVDGGRPVTLFRGASGASGAVDVVFTVPEDVQASQSLIVETSSQAGASRIEQAVTLSRDYRILLTTDKPIYQPGHVIHIRGLALSTFDLNPAAGQELVVSVADGKGNKVFKKRLILSDFGMAATDFQLASEVNTGAYKISAELVGSETGASVVSEKTVTVEPYVLPKFAVDIETDRTYYQPGGYVRGSLKADYFFGKPVSEAQVELVGYTFDVQRNDFMTLQGQTDADGSFDFEFQLPDYIAGSDLEGGRGRFYLQASLTDQAQHTEISNISLPVAGSALVIEAVPEGGRFHPGLENILYVLTSYPDGLPAETDLNITFYENGQTVQARTGPYGLAEVRFTPQNPFQQFSVQAGDAQGNRGQRDFYYEGEYAEETVLLRVDRPVYRVGDAMQLTILTSQPQGTVYLDIVREGQTVSTRSLEVKNGHSEAVVDLTPDLFGTLELHAYKIMPSGSIARDTRLVVVDHADDLQVALSPGQDTYRPGDTAQLGIQVNGQDGQGVQSLLGLAIVDESVFALAEQDPGFAKLYFMLEQELLQPKYDLHGYGVTDLLGGVPEQDPELISAVETTAEASLAAAQAAPGALPFRLNASSAMQFVERAYERQQQYFDIMSKALFGLMILLPVGMLVLSAVALRRERRLGRGVALAVGIFLLLLLVLATWLPGNGWSNSWLFQWAGGWLILLLVLVGFAGYITLVVVAWRRKDSLLGWSLLLLPAILILAFFLIFAVYQSGLSGGETALIALVIAVALLPLAYLLRFAGFSLSGSTLPALACLALAVGLILGLFPLAVTAGSFSGAPELRFRGAQFDAVPPPMAVEEMMPLAAMAPMPTEAAAVMDLQVPVEKEVAGSESQQASTAAEPPRLRQYFPETMLWLPDAVTNPDGSLMLDVAVADSITTWRISALASSQDGRLGSATAPLRVFQDFFIDLDLPVALTVGDEVAVPVGVFNYLPEPQSVRLELEAADWYDLLDEPVKTIDIAAGDIVVVYFRVRARDFGRRPFQVTAIGSRLSDAIRKEVQVYPDGKPFNTSRSDRLTPGTPVQEIISFPTDTIAGTQMLMVKIYPGVLSQVVEGLDSILRMPNGCFEQTSSTTYPNVLVLDYLKSTGQASPEVQFKAEEYINLGYQRLATFEVDGGGFSLFGDVPADRMLTAYGLQEFADMRRVYEIDPALLERAANWLLSQQQGDGTWQNDQGLVHENTWASLGDDRLPVTAYITWSMVEAGYQSEAGTQKGLQYLRENQSKAEDAYVLALVTNALVAADLGSEGKIAPATQAVLDRLAGMASQQGDKAYWQSGVATFMGSEGLTGSVETTALAALALLRADSHPDLANAALGYLVQQKDSFGTWYSTQATVLTLKAMLESVRRGTETSGANVTVTLNGSQTRSVEITPENMDVVQMIAFEDANPTGDNRIEINAEGEGNLMYQITGRYYLPWDKLVQYPELGGGAEQVSIAVIYDRTDLAVNDTVKVDVTVTMNQPGNAEAALIDLGVPPGFIVLAEDLQALVTYYDDIPADYPNPTIERYELTGRQILVYVKNLSQAAPLQFSYRLRAKFPLVAKAPASQAYDYYNPDQSGEQAPQVLVVNP